MTGVTIDGNTALTIRRSLGDIMERQQTFIILIIIIIIRFRQIVTYNPYKRSQIYLIDSNENTLIPRYKTVPLHGRYISFDLSATVICPL